MPHSHRFGRAELRPTERQLLVDGSPAVLGSRAFDLLLALVDRRERLVSKNELLEVVWPGLVVEENNLAVQISTLRKILGPQAIVTVPGRGYRFALPLHDAAVPESPAPAADAPRSAMPPLPSLAAPLIGRDDDLASLQRALRQACVVTVVGAGGVGKTTLALAAAHAVQATYRDGAAWADLSQAVDAARLPASVAQAVGLAAGAADDPLPALTEALKPLELLLVLDNAEHLLGAVGRFVRGVMSAAPGVQLLVTSQAALKVDGERVFRLGALPLPETGAAVGEALRCGAVALFVDRAIAADRRFALTDDNVAAVATTCRRLDGVPLAIKLAAARLPLLGLGGLAARLGDRLKLLADPGRDAPPRQQTLRAALDWSHGLLGAAEQAVLRRLAVFVGGFTLELAAAVARDDTLDEWQVLDALGELVDRSLVAMDAGDVPRYRLLDTVRDYAAAKLDAAGEASATRLRHAEARAAQMEAAYDAYWARPDGVWLDAYAPEIDNLRSVLDWSTAQRSDLALRLIASASVLFLLLGQSPEARRRFAALEAVVDAHAPDAVAARYWLERSRIHWGVSNAAMLAQAQKAAALYRAIGERRGLYLALRCIAGSDALSGDEASALLDDMRGLEVPDWPPRLRAQRLLAESGVLAAAGRANEARAVSQALVALASAAGLPSVASAARSGLAGAHLMLGEPDEALRCARAILDEPAARRGNFVLHALGVVAEVHLAHGRLAEARHATAELIAALRSRDWEWAGLYADRFALLAIGEGRAAAAACLIGHADRARREAGVRDAAATPARARAMPAVEAALDASAIARLMAEGARMDADHVCALALEAPRTSC